LQRDVAIKVPSYRGANQASAAGLQRFLRETRVAAAVRHPHVCPIYDVGEEAGRPYVVMALVEGESLAERLRRQGRFDEPRDAVTLVVKVAAALAAVHAAHIVHRDLKPGNILLDRAGQPFLTDFGLAFADDGEHLTATSQLLGTPAYMAPEQASPDLGPVGAWSDQYSLGVVLYELLTGRLPFEGSVRALIFQIGSKPVPPPSQHRPDLDHTLEATCLKALAKLPAQRFGSMQEFAITLDDFLKRDRVDSRSDVVTIKREPRPSQSATSDETKRLYDTARYYLEKAKEETHRKSIAIFGEILDKDPTFARAWAGLAFAYHLLSVRGFTSPTNVYPKAKSAALRALGLDASVGEAHMVLATLLMEYEWDLAGAERTFRLAIELQPDHAGTHQLYGKCLACQGRHDEAIAALRRAEELDPLSAILSTSVGRHGFLLARRYDEAVRQYQKTLETDPAFWLTHRFLGWAYVLQGKLADGVKSFVTATQLHKDQVTLAGLGYAYAASGEPNKAREILDSLNELGKSQYVSPDCQVILSIGLGDKDQAFSWLNIAMADRSEGMCKIRVDPVLDPLRSDSRFDALLQRMKVKL
jgi:serine/threonine protein kinase/Flp pilus assembly protein TadD